MKTQAALQIRTPAKINTFLHVLRHRADGYHELHLSYVPVSLYDELYFEHLPRGGIELTVEGGLPGVGAEDNLVYRAAMAFYGATGVEPALQVRLRKRIPVGAGLGGGSGNAGGTLRALNALHGHPLPEAQLARLALTLGADVPFFLAPRPMTALGVGERLTPWAGLAAWPLLIVHPGFAIATAHAYGLVRPRERPLAVPRGDSLQALVAHLENDFEAALFPRHPALAEIKARLLAAGAAGALLSGSGSAVFGIFAAPAERDRAAASLASAGLGLLLSCEILLNYDYISTAPASRCTRPRA